MNRAQKVSSHLTINSCCVAALCFAASSALVATEYADLKRMEPVPANEPIPIVDFVRPPLFDDVQLSHTGTRVGALVPSTSDQRSLVTYDLEDQTLDGVSAPPGDREISSFFWLDGDRLAYVVTDRSSGATTLNLATAGKLAIATSTWDNQGAGGSVTILTNTPDDRTQFLLDLRGEGLRYDQVEMVNAHSAALIVRYPDLKTDHGFNNFFVPDKLEGLPSASPRRTGF